MSSLVQRLKHLSSDIYEDISLPTNGQMILKVGDPKGNNLHEVMNDEGEKFMASMPKKFRKTTWIKRKDFIIAEPITEGNKVKAEIVRILYAHQIKYFVEKKVWPQAFQSDISKLLKVDESHTNHLLEYDSDDDDLDLLVCNPNRINLETYEESDESSSSDSESSSSDSECLSSDSESSSTDSKSLPLPNNKSFLSDKKQDSLSELS